MGSIHYVLYTYMRASWVGGCERGGWVTNANCLFNILSVLEITSILDEQITLPVID